MEGMLIRMPIPLVQRLSYQDDTSCSTPPNAIYPGAALSTIYHYHPKKQYNLDTMTGQAETVTLSSEPFPVPHLTHISRRRNLTTHPSPSPHPAVQHS